MVDAVKAKIPLILATAPKGLKISLTFDQSQLRARRACGTSCAKPAIAAGLVALMVLMFLGSPRSMLIVIISIPLSILTAIIGLKLSGQTINIMTLGGLALAVGMLVDDATVEIENIHRNHAMRKPLLVAILDGASQIATPDLRRHALDLHRVFPGRAAVRRRAVSVHAARAGGGVRDADVVSAVAHAGAHDGALSAPGRSRGTLGAWPVGQIWCARFDRWFERLQGALSGRARGFIARRGLALACVAILVVLSLGSVAGGRRGFLSGVDAGMMRLHVRAPTGTRIEQTEYIVDQIERTIRTVIPPAELESISDNIGLPISYVLAFYQTDSIGPQDADMLIQLKPGHHPTAMYEQRIRDALAREFPDVQVYFQAADIVSQVLNFGLPAAIDAQITGNESAERLRYRDAAARSGWSGFRAWSTCASRSRSTTPALQVEVDRAKALQLGVTQQEVASSLLTSLSGDALLAAELLARSEYPGSTTACSSRRRSICSTRSARWRICRSARPLLRRATRLSIRRPQRGHNATAAAVARQRRDRQPRLSTPPWSIITPCSA